MANLTLGQFSRALRSAVRELRANRNKDTVKVALGTLALVKRRVIQTGVNANGAKFSDYSEAYVPYWYFGSSYERYNLSTDFSIPQKREEMLDKYGYFGTYTQWRETLGGRPTGYKNFSLTGGLWERMKPVVISRSSDTTTIQYRGSLGIDNDRTEWLSNYEGINITAPSKGEIETMEKLNTQRFNKILKKHGIE